MGLTSWLGFNTSAVAALPSLPTAPSYELIPEGVSLDEYLRTTLSQPVEKLWREQPHLRTVVGFVSRNIAQLGLHAFQRDGDDGRNRLRNTPLTQLLDEPNDDVTTFELIEATVASRMLYDQTYWYIGTDPSAPSGWVLRHIPTPWVIGTVGSSAFSVKGYKVALPDIEGRHTVIPSSDMIAFHGWSPVDPKVGASPVDALKTILAEQIHAQVFRDQMWLRGGRVGSYISRPQGADWSPEARERFAKQYQEAYAGDRGGKAGGTPLLEDGMELKSNRFSAKDEQFIESSKLSLETCAQVYHINPTMIGLLDNANYSNVREFRKMLYGDNLGPEIVRLEQRINRKLVPRMADASTVYVEFNLQAKLAGSFEEQASVMQTAVGAPWMLINEARAKQNMPAIDGGNELIRPLNLTQPGDQEPIPAEEPTSEDTSAD